MARSGGSPLLGHLEDTGDSLLEHWQLRAHFTGPFVEHHSRFSDPSRDIRNQHEVKQWAKVKKLGEGGGGKVYLQKERGGAERAVKKVGRKTSGKNVLEYLREILAMAKFSKEAAYFIQLFGWYSNERHIFIAMEYIRYGSLHDCVKHPLPESEARTITQQVVEALEILHRKNWAHRDLKPSNVFVIRMGPSWWVKLGDFGVSKSVANEMTQYRTYLETDFTAPEIIGFSGAGPAEASGYTNAADLWSLGFFVHWMLTLRLPLTRPEMGAFCSGALPRLPQQHLQQQSVTEDGIDIILSLLKPQPSQRPNAHHIREHKWLQDVAIMSLPMQSNTSPEQYRGDSPYGPAPEHKVPPYMDYHAQHSPNVFPSALNPSDSLRRPYGENNTPSVPPYYPPHISFGSFPQASRVPDGATPDFSKFRTRSYPSQGEASRNLTSSYNADPNPENQIPRKGKSIMIVNPTTMKEHPLSELSPSGPPSATEATPDPHMQPGTVAVKASERRMEVTQGTVAQEAAAKTNLSWALSEDVAGRKAAEKTIGSKERPPKAILAGKPTTGTSSQMAAIGDAENKETRIVDSFKQFANTEKHKLQERRRAQALQDRTSKLEGLLRFSESFKLKTPIPDDLVGILATDPIKQQQIIEKARREVEETKNTITDQNYDDDQTSVPEKTQRQNSKQQVTKQDQPTAVGQQKKHTATPASSKPVVRMPPAVDFTALDENRPALPEPRDSSWVHAAAERSRRIEDLGLRTAFLNATAAAAAEKDASLTQKRQPRQKKKWIKVPFMPTTTFNAPVRKP